MHGPIALLFMLGAASFRSPGAQAPPDLRDAAWHVAGQAEAAPRTDRDSGAQLVEVALTYLGRPYRRGGQDPATGVDCATFVRLLFRPLGVELPYTAAGQMTFGAVVLEDELAPGDLVFFRDTYRRGISHVGIYVGDGRFVHAAGRKSGVIVSTLFRPYYQRHFAGARRLLDQRLTPRAPDIDAPAEGELLIETR